MRDYPSEYDEYHASEIKGLHLPEWIDAIYCGEDGAVFAVVTNAPYTTHAVLEIAKDTEDDEGAEKAAKAWLEAYAAKCADLRRRVCAADERWRKSEPKETWEQFWQIVFDFAMAGVDVNKPGTVIVKYVDEAGDWEPEYCDDCDTYHKYAYDYECGRDEDGELYVEVGRCDSDGDWSYDRWYEADWVYLWREYMGSDHYFIRWAHYFQWCYENGHLDPLDDFYRKTATIEDMAAACEDNLKYLEKEDQS